MADLKTTVSKLSYWNHSVDPQPLGGGITNTNFIVTHENEEFVVRLGEDIPVHGVYRANELAAAKAAYAAGISPEIIYHEPGALVMRRIQGKTLQPEDIRKPEILKRLIPVLHRCHQQIPNYFHGATSMFWVFQVVRNYVRTLHEGNSRMIPELPRLQQLATELEEGVGPIQVVYGHNDLLAANFIDDGEQIWLIDWEYAGFNSPLFDLGGLASNNELQSDQEEWLIEAYFGVPVTDQLRRSYAAMKCASLLRESMWSMVSEIYLDIDFDYVTYTNENITKFELAYSEFKDMT